MGGNSLPRHDRNLIRLSQTYIGAYYYFTRPHQSQKKIGTKREKYQFSCRTKERPCYGYHWILLMMI
jgi:hypothetical protein